MKIKLISLMAMMFAASLFAGDGDKVIGKWNTPENKSQIEIYKCGETYCGKIIDIKEKVYPKGDKDAGKVKVDRKNPDKKKRKDPILGLELMKGFKFSGKTWSGGTIYDPERGKTYKCKMTLDGDKLNVRGYVGIPTLGRTSVWTKAE